MTVAEIYSFFFLNICLAFYGFIDRTAEDMTGNRERERERGGMTCSKGTQARSGTQVCCRASAHGMRALPTELNCAPGDLF